MFCGVGWCKSQDLEHLFLTYIRAWYTQTPQQPPAAGVLPDLDVEDTAKDSQD